MYLYACVGTLQCTYVYLCISINCICLCLFYTVHMLACFRTWGHYYFLQGMCVFSLFPLSNIPSSRRTFSPNVKYLASWVVVNYLLLEVPRDKIWMMLYLRVIQKLQKFHVNSIEFTLRKKNNYVHKTCDHSKHLLWESKIHLLYLKRETNTSHLQQYCHPIWYLPTHANNKYPAAPAQTSQSWTGTHTFSPKVVEREMEETSTRRG